jgi:hypothetical protein
MIAELKDAACLSWLILFSLASCMITELKDAACLSHAARRWLPPSKTGKPVHTSVLMRWADRGIVGPGGERIYLSTWRCGGQRMTSQAAIEEFLLALNAGSPAAKSDADADLARRAAAASKALQDLGC